MLTNDYDAALQALLASLPPLPVPQQATTPSQNPTDAQAQQQTPARVVRTGEQVYSKPTKLTNAACPSGCTFEGKIYSYQIVDAKGNPVKGSMTASEQLKAVPPTKTTPRPLSGSAPNGQFRDAVGATAPFKAGRSVVDQRFTVTQNGHSYPLTTTIRQTVVIDDRGRVFVSERTLVP
jgi:hypothetical protein